MRKQTTSVVANLRPMHSRGPGKKGVLVRKLGGWERREWDRDRC